MPLAGWTALTLAIILEIVATSLLKLSSGFEKWIWGATAIALYATCFILLASALKTIPVGVAYAIWSGIGIVAISLIGLLFFAERLSVVQIACLALIVAGCVGLRLTTAD